MFDEIKNLSAYGLSGMADSASPDTNESPGASFLTGIRDHVVESVEYLMGSDGMSAADAAEHMTVHGTDHEIADGAIPVYTATKWATFVDLAAYHEDITELGEPSGDLDHDSNVALYLIASRLVSCLLGEIEEIEPDDDGPKYVATINIPGYLPMDDEPPVFDTAAEAWAYLEQERQESEEHAAEGDAFVASDCLTELRRVAEEAQTFGGDTGTVYGDTPGYDGDHDLGLAYSVSEVWED